jgi:hypothetical protein
MKYWIAKKGSKVVGKHYGTKATARQLFPDAYLYEVDDLTYSLIRVGDEY